MNFVTVNLKRISYFVHVFLPEYAENYVCLLLLIHYLILPYRYSKVHKSGAVPFVQMTLDELETEIT